MSSIVENNVSGGVDLSSLTSGELWLIGMFNGVRLGGSSKNAYFGTGHSSSDIEYDLDFSSVSSIVVNGVAVQKFIVGTASGNIETSVATAGTTVNLSSVTKAYAYVYSSYSSTLVLWVSSYTTTDGKVHTASNLNY